MAHGVWGAGRRVSVGGPGRFWSSRWRVSGIDFRNPIPNPSTRQVLLDAFARYDARDARGRTAKEIVQA